MQPVLNAAIPSESKSKGNILIIDDDDHIRSAFASYLENFGYQMKMARDGNEAKTLLDQVKFDVVLMDVCLPDYNGLELLTEIKKAHPFLEVNSWVMTGCLHGSRN